MAKITSIFAIVVFAAQVFSAEFELSDKLVVDGSSLFRSTASFSGNVGIGTVNPAGKLSIDNSGSNTPGDGFLWVGMNASPTWVFRNETTGGDLMIDFINGGIWYNAIALDRQSGYVGIGTQTPGQLLDVNGNFKVAGSGSIGGGLTLGSANEATLMGSSGDSRINIFPTGSGGAEAGIHIVGNTGAWTFAKGSVILRAGNVAAPADWQRSIRFQTYNGADMAVIDPSGNVGIGKTPGSYALDVNGTTNAGYFKGDGSQLTGITGVFNGLQVLTGGSTYTPAQGTNSIIVQLVAGGGGGGGSWGGQTGGGGGGSGGYALKRFTGISGTYSYSIGAGGAGVSSAGGNAGGNTTFTGPGGVTVTAYGGKGGLRLESNDVYCLAAGGLGGDVSTGGDLNGAGSPGQYGVRLQNYRSSGAGGSGVFGGGGGASTLDANGNNAAGYGSGGGGAYASGDSRAGGNGSQGVIIVYEYK